MIILFEDLNLLFDCHIRVLCKVLTASFVLSNKQLRELAELLGGVNEPLFLVGCVTFIDQELHLIASPDGDRHLLSRRCWVVNLCGHERPPPWIP